MAALSNENARPMIGASTSFSLLGREFKKVRSTERRLGGDWGAEFRDSKYGPDQVGVGLIWPANAAHKGKLCVLVVIIIAGYFKESRPEFLAPSA